VTAFGEGAEGVTASQTDLAGNVSGNTAHAFSVDTLADAPPPASVVITDNVPGYINGVAGHNAAVAYTIADLDLVDAATAAVTFHSAGGGADIVVGGLLNGAYTVDLSSLSDGLVTASMAITDTNGNTAVGTPDTTTLDTVGPAYAYNGAL